MRTTTDPDLMETVIAEEGGSVLILNEFELDLTAPDSLAGTIMDAIDEGEHLYAIITVSKDGDPDDGNRLCYIPDTEAFVPEWLELRSRYAEGELTVTFYGLTGDLHDNAQKVLQSY
jgi:hypothetical protein